MEKHYMAHVRIQSQDEEWVDLAEESFPRLLCPFLCKFPCWLRGSAGGGLATREFMQSCEIISLYKILWRRRLLAVPKPQGKKQLVFVE